MEGLKSFLFFNELSQAEVAEFLGVSASYMSRMVSGKAPLQPEHIAKLVANDKGWNTEFISDPLWAGMKEVAQTKDSGLAQEVAKLRAENELLRQQLEWMKGLVEKAVNQQQ